MSDICMVTTFLDKISGFFVKISRRQIAERLKDGDLTDEQCRQFIIRELDDIKSKIDGLARKDLLASIDFLEQGIRLFKLAREEPSEGQTAMVATRQQDDGPINQACALLLSEEIKRLKITSNEHYAKALRYFEESEKEATRAFNNEALSVADRILATRMRMVSMIFQNIQDPDAAIVMCRMYLEKLHKLPAIEKMFAVHLSGRLKARLNKNKRIENVISVTMLNHVLCDFEKKFGQTRSNLERLFNWPTIQVGKESYNPLITHKKIASEIVRSSETSPTMNMSAAYFGTFIIECWSSISAVTSDRKILAINREFGHEVFLFDVSGDSKRVFWSLPKMWESISWWKIQAILTDEKDNVFVAYSSISKISGNKVYKLVCLDLNGNVRSECTLKFLVCDRVQVDPKYTITKDGKVVIIIFDGNVYVCDSNSGELKNTLRGKIFSPSPITVTDTNQIILAADRTRQPVHVWSMEGDLIRKIEFPGATNHVVDSFKFTKTVNLKLSIASAITHPLAPYLLTDRSLTFAALRYFANENLELRRPEDSAAFNHVTKDILMMMTNKNEDSISFTLLKFPENSDRPETVDMTWFEGGKLISHPSGPVALINDNSVLFLQ